jgi:hypothetical protein
VYYLYSLARFYPVRNRNNAKIEPRKGNGMETAETKDVGTTEVAKEATDLDAASVRNHPLFAKLAKELKTYQSKIEKIEEEKADREKSMRVQSEIEKGNFEAARKELESQANLRVQQLAAEKDALAKSLQMERASTKLVAAGVASEKVAAFIATEYFAMPDDARPELSEWIQTAKESDEFSPFFRSAQSVPVAAPKDRAGVSIARSSGGESSKYKEILNNPRNYTTSEVAAATKWRSNYVAVNGKLP